MNVVFTLITLPRFLLRFLKNAFLENLYQPIALVWIKNFVLSKSKFYCIISCFWEQKIFKNITVLSCKNDFKLNFIIFYLWNLKNFFLKKAQLNQRQYLKGILHLHLKVLFHKHLHFTNNILNVLYFQSIQAFICYN